jgi:hypothetical protein
MGHVIGQRDILLVAVVVGGKAQQLGDALLVGRVFADAFLEHLAELGPEGGVLVLLRLVFAVGQLFQQASTRLAEPSRMARTSRDSCRISRETFSGRSAESITPLTKRRYTGISCSASSMMNTRLT